MHQASLANASHANAQFVGHFDNVLVPHDEGGDVGYLQEGGRR